jgi:hypothetical protein
MPLEASLDTCVCVPAAFCSSASLSPASPSTYNIKHGEGISVEFQ